MRGGEGVGGDEVVWECFFAVRYVWGFPVRRVYEQACVGHPCIKSKTPT